MLSVHRDRTVHVHVSCLCDVLPLMSVLKLTWVTMASAQKDPHLLFVLHRGDGFAGVCVCTQSAVMRSAVVQRDKWSKYKKVTFHAHSRPAGHKMDRV